MNLPHFVKAFLKTKLLNTNSYSEDAMVFSQIQDFCMDDIECSQLHGGLKPSSSYTANWYLPGFQNPFYGGIMTILRFATYLLDHENIHQRFLICGNEDAAKVQKSIVAAFPSLEKSEILILNSSDAISQIPESDISFATLWTTAYVLLRIKNTKLKFYFIQDFEPLFYPAGSTYAQVEATYRFGFYGITNTISLRKIYESEYGGQGIHFTPCVDTNVFYPNLEPRKSSDCKRIFFYGRPNHPRNAFELAISAMRLVKGKYGNSVEILSAGADWNPQDYGLEGIVQNLGLLNYKETGDLYRSCDIGLSMMMTKHPSYLPFEMMACGVLVIANVNNSTSWLLKNRQNCLITYPSATCIFKTIEEAIENMKDFEAIKQNATSLILKYHSSWTTEFQKVSEFILSLISKTNRDNKGYLVQCNSSDDSSLANKVFFLQNKTRYHVPSKEWIESHGFSWPNDINYIDASTLHNLNDGGSVTGLYSSKDYMNPPRRSSLEMRQIASSQLYGYGIEVGAGASPFPIPKHCHVKYADKISIESLQSELYPGQKPSDLIHPDICDDLESLDSIEDSSLDFIIACHVIEHTKNPLKALRQAYIKLRYGGSLVLVIPDQGRTFDKTRELTSLEHLILDYHYPSRDRDKEHYIDFYTFAFQTAPNNLDRVVEDKFTQDYSIHFHTWNYESFGKMIDYSIVSSISPWSSVWSQPTLDHPTEDIEFYFVLTK
jgi:O-antigen biosynthesis protein